jgi:hypothetical protein
MRAADTTSRHRTTTPTLLPHTTTTGTERASRLASLS